MKKIKLTESKLRSIIKEAINEIFENEQNDREWAKYSLQNTMNSALRHGRTDPDFVCDDENPDNDYNENVFGFGGEDEDGYPDPWNEKYHTMSIGDPKIEDGKDAAIDDIDFDNGHKEKDYSTQELSNMATSSAETLKQLDVDDMYRRYGNKNIEDDRWFAPRNSWVHNGEVEEEPDGEREHFAGPRFNGNLPAGDYTQNSITGPLDETIKRNIRKVLREMEDTETYEEDTEAYEEDTETYEVIAQYDGRVIVKKEITGLDAAFDFAEQMTDDLRNKGIEVDNEDRFYASIEGVGEYGDCFGYFCNEKNILEPGEKGFWMD